MRPAGVPRERRSSRRRNWVVGRFSVGGTVNYSTPLVDVSICFGGRGEGEVSIVELTVKVRFGHLGHDQIDYLLYVFLGIGIPQYMPELLKIALQLLKIYEEYKSTSLREDLRIEEVVRRESRNEYAV
jgi:hypothetical protein